LAAGQLGTGVAELVVVVVEGVVEAIVDVKVVLGVVVGAAVVVTAEVVVLVVEAGVAYSCQHTSHIDGNSSGHLQVLAVHMTPAILVDRSIAVLANDMGKSVLIRHCPTPAPSAAPWL